MFGMDDSGAFRRSFTIVLEVFVGGCLFGWLILAIIKTIGAQVKYANVSKSRRVVMAETVWVYILLAMSLFAVLMTLQFQTHVSLCT